jgi:hypothetical protein
MGLSPELAMRHGVCSFLWQRVSGCPETGQALARANNMRLLAGIFTTLMVRGRR